MDSFEFTKYAASVLAALLVMFGSKAFIELNSGHSTDKAGYALPAPAPAETAEAKPAEGDKAAAPAEAGGDAKAGDVVALLAKANAENGKGAFAKCKACHVVEKGKPHTVGPNLWGVVNRPKGSTEFEYSAGMKAKGGDWTFADLSAFIRNPKGYVSGTKMNFAGIGDPAAEADVIAYLATLADAPVPMPK